MREIMVRYKLRSGCHDDELRTDERERHRWHTVVFLHRDEYRDGAEYGTANLALSLQDGTLHAKTIATTHTFYDDAGRPHVSYENAAGASISEKAYHKTLENVFAHSETTLVTFPWLIYHRDTFHEWKEKSPTDIYTLLLDTYLNFSGEKEGMG